MYEKYFSKSPSTTESDEKFVPVTNFSTIYDARPIGESDNATPANISFIIHIF